MAGGTNFTDPKPQWAVPLALGGSQAMDYRFHSQTAQHLPTPSKFWVITRTGYLDKCSQCDYDLKTQVLFRTREGAVTIIRVETVQLRTCSHGIGSVGARVSRAGRHLLGVGEDAPSYEGQFGPVVASISAGAFARGQALQSALIGLGERLVTIASAFDAADMESATHFRLSGGGIALQKDFSSFRFLLTILGTGWKTGGKFLNLVPLAVTVTLGRNWTRISDTFRGLWFPWEPQQSPELLSPLSPTPPVMTGEKSQLGKLLEEAPAAVSKKQTSTSKLGQLMEEVATAEQDYGFDVPIKKQGSLGGYAACVPTAASMITDYYHQQNADLKTKTPKEFVDMLDKGDLESGVGMSPDNLTDELHDIGYKYITAVSRGSWKRLQNELRDGPVMAQVKLDTHKNRLSPKGNVIHAVVVEGISPDGTKVKVVDPWVGKELELSRSEFDASWGAVSDTQKGYDRPMYIIRP
ncbi:hypothetical protein D6779_09595 [Candidatus Parcubacteria bacterium]|nr:MAG: hypothetical protein D6779_09595 [Candidatus Parcubacteria bacterium]